MRHLTLTIIGFIIAGCISGQEIDFSQKWKDSVIERNSYFDRVDLETVSYLDLSKIISNQLRMDNDPWSTYIGVFGPKFRRIDFHLIAEKDKLEKGEYLVSGKSRLGKNIRVFEGKMNLNTVLIKPQMFNVDTMFICLFDYHFLEPGDKDGDGEFKGVFSTIFYLRNGELQLFWSESGDYRDLNNVFVGIWERFNSEVKRQCIFTFHPAGLYNKLPYCDKLYRYEDNFDDFTYIKEEYLDFGWSDYDPSDGDKTDWWK